MGMHKRVLIANRGEIAIRIAKAAHALGMETVSVYAPVDGQALHTRMTTHSAMLPTDGIAGYLEVAALVRIAEETGCDCVHPGYGFLLSLIHI